MLRPIFFATLITLIATCAFANAPAPTEPAPAITPESSLKALTEGNKRFRESTSQYPRQDEERRCATFAGGQHPIAAVLSCADSRVPVEIVFDQGIGDLFVVRVAGNVANTDELGTFEYGVEHLHIPLIVVLGHSKCGAVTAVVDDAKVEGNLAKLVAPIAPAVANAHADFPKLEGRKLVPAAIRANVLQAMVDLTTKSEVIGNAVKEGKVKVVGGVYNLVSGEIDWLDADVQALAKKAAASEELLAADTHTSGHDAAESHEKSSSHEKKPEKKKTSKAHGDEKDSKHDDADEEKSSDEKEEKSGEEKGHASAKTETKSTLAVVKENWLALGALLLGSTAMSGGLIAFFGRGKKSSAPAPADKGHH